MKNQIPKIPKIRFFGMPFRFYLITIIYYYIIVLVKHMKYYNRDIKDLFLEYANNFKTVLVTGPRQVGKTTLLKELKEKKRKYVTLDDLKIRSFANNNPDEFFKKNCPPVIIDEIQYAPNLLSYIKIICDNTNERNLFWLTGSQKIQIMKNVSETLVGRMGVLEMYSLSNREIISSNYLPLDVNNLIESECLNKSDIISKMYKGSMPDIIFNDTKRDLFYGSYVNLYIERDIRELKDVQDLETFKTFIGLVASRAGQLINYNKLASESGISDKMAKSWLSILENTGIVSFIYQYKKDEFKKSKTHPKLIFMDTGLCIYLLGIKNITSLNNYTSLGRLFENYIISEILKNNINFNLNYDFSYYRDDNGREIDLIITDENNDLHLYEIKMNDKVDERMINGFKALSGLRNIKSGGIICTAKNFTKLNEDNFIIPVSAIIN